jgi:hypothetical protein
LSPDGFGKESIINMDETSIYLDFPSKVTYERKGTKRVKSVTTGGGRVRLSAAFSTTASGEKLLILILVPRKTPLPDNSFIGGKSPTNVYLIYKPSATFDETVVCKYLDNIVQPYKTGNQIKKSAILLDSARCHNTKSVKEKLDQLSIKKISVPPRMTNLLQPADVSWFRPLKQNYNRLWIR